jgi:hypothetical protein
VGMLTNKFFVKVCSLIDALPLQHFLAQWGDQLEEW